VKCHYDGQILLIEFAESEKEMLLFSFEELREHYSTDESKLPSKLRKFWRGTLSRTPEKTAEWSEAEEDLASARWGIKSERLIFVNQWLSSTGLLLAANSSKLSLDPSECEQFLCIINDRRLLLALDHQLDDVLMEQNPINVPDHEAQQALWEIHFLAHIQQQVLDAINPPD
jgi:hypothetical protein